MSVEILRTGPLALLQDLGRPGHAAVGVSRSGAFDRSAHRLANSLVGNSPGAATVEVLLGGLLIRFEAPALIALTGADGAALIEGRPIPWGTACRVNPGQLLSLGPPGEGLRSYLAVAGGFTVPPMLGSRSSDVLSGIGPPPLAAGDRLPFGPAGPVRGHLSVWTELPVAVPAASRRAGPVLGVLPGPRLDWLADPATILGDWVVSPASNRIGVRLAGRRLDWAASRLGQELPSEPLVRGAIQVPPGGEPIIFGPDHPTTGGYPVVAVLTASATDALAQHRPGDRIVLQAASGPALT